MQDILRNIVHVVHSVVAILGEARMSLRTLHVLADCMACAVGGVGSLAIVCQSRNPDHCRRLVQVKL